MEMRSVITHHRSLKLCSVIHHKINYQMASALWISTLDLSMVVSYDLITAMLKLPLQSRPTKQQQVPLPQHLSTLKLVLFKVE